MSWVPAAMLIAAIALQALLPRLRVPVVVAAAGVAVAVVVAGHVASSHEVLAAVPWDVLVLLVALGAISQLFADARVFERVAVAATRRGAADPRAIVVAVAVVMYVVSGLVNNLTALLLVLPIVLVLLRLTGTSRRHARWTVSILLVACNLGGAATPIGDFPAVLLLGSGAMEFGPYLARALPITAAALAVLLALVVVVVRPARDVATMTATRKLTIAVVHALHRRVRVRMRLVVPAAIALGVMLVLWTALPPTVAPPELVPWLCVPCALLCVPREAAGILRRSVDVEAVLFLFALFVLVGCAQKTGLFTDLGRFITSLPLSPQEQLLVFLVVAGVLTGVFSAGPSMAALLPVAHTLAGVVPADAVYVGLALSVCAGSSLFLTAATSGPLAQGLVDAAALSDVDGRPIRVGFAEFLPAGLLSFAVIETAALLWAIVDA